MIIHVRYIEHLHVHVYFIESYHHVYQGFIQDFLLGGGGGGMKIKFATA